MHLKIAKNVIYQILARAVSALAGLITTVLIAGNLGASVFGEYIKIITFVGFFYLFSDMGLNAIYLQKDTEHVHFKDLFYTRLTVSIALTIIAILLGFLLPYNNSQNLGFSQNAKTGIAIFSLSIVMYAILLTSQAVFQKALEYKKLFIANSLGSVVTLTGVYLVLINSLGIFGILAALIFGDLLAAISSMFLAERKILPAKVNLEFIKELTIESFPLMLMLVFNLVYFRIDTILLSFLKPSQDVGIYGLSYRFFDFLLAIPLFFANALYPSFIQRAKNYRKGIIKEQTYSFVLILISFSLSFVFWFAAPLFTIINNSFNDSILPFRLLILSLPFFFLSSFFQWYLIAHKKQKFLLGVYIISAVINVILNFVFIPIASYKASAIITGVTEGFVCLLLFIEYKKIVHD